MQDESLLVDQPIEDYEIWSFPPLNNDAHSPPEQNQDLKKENEKTAELLQTERNEIIQLKRILQDNIMLLNQLQGKLQETIEQVDEDLLVKVVECTKNITRKILFKELKDDPSRLLAMISVETMQMKLNQDCAILLSSDDFNALKNEDVGNLKPFLQASSELNHGDFKIVTPTGEILAILEDRLNAYFGF